MNTTDSRPAMAVPVPEGSTPDAPNNTHPAGELATPGTRPPDGPNSRSTTKESITIMTPSSGPTSPVAEATPVPRRLALQGNQATGGQPGRDTQLTRAAGSNVPDPVAICATAPIGSSLLDPALALAADILDDLERVRIANQNRLRQLTRTGEDADGEERGFGLDESHPDVARLAAMVETLEKVEHDATLNLQRKMRKHPLGAWVKAQRGIGEKQGARLLAAIGDPYINSAKGTPRTVSALWAYCGLHVLPAGQPRVDAHRLYAGGDQLGDPGPWRTDALSPGAGVAAKRRKGERSNWSGNAKMRSYLVAESCMKTGKCPDCRDGEGRADTHTGTAVPAQDEAGRDGQGAPGDQARIAVPACSCSPYRVKYDARRAHTAVTHPDWTDGHSHNDALRVTAKEVLKHLWRAARDHHLGVTS